MNDMLADLTVLRARAVFNIYSAPGKPTERKNRGSWAILYKYEGETHYECAGRTCVSNAQSAIILPASSSYTWQCKAGGHYCTVEFDADVTCEQILSIPLGGEGERLLRIMREAEQKYNLRAPGYRLELMHLIYGALVLLCGVQRRDYADGGHRQKIAPALDYISKNYNVMPKNDYLAALCGISTVYFRKLFSRIAGCSPIAYIHRLRIAQAKRMLQSDCDHVGEIALSLGYPDIYTFSKTFKKHTGLSPTHYLKAKQKKTEIS